MNRHPLKKEGKKKMRAKEWNEEVIFYTAIKQNTEKILCLDLLTFY